MRESLMYGSVRGARGNSRPYRDAREDRFGSFASKAAEAVRPCNSAALPKADVNSTFWPPTLGATSRREQVQQCAQENCVYSMISSASVRKLSERLRPSAFPVLRLNTSSNLLGR